MGTFVRLSTIIAFFVGLVRPIQAQTFQPAPLVRGPGVSQEQIEAMSEAQASPTLADFLDMNRPEQEVGRKLQQLVERAQTAWLSGSIESARSLFREIVKETLDADWRAAQREAIHYAYLRLAQSSPTSTERDNWLESAVGAFPDLSSDDDTFPPPLVSEFNSTRQRILALAKPYSPFPHFPDHRFLLINGKRFVLTPELRIRLPTGTFRVTALSDAHAPVTERLTNSQLEVFRLSLPALGSGTCESPSGPASVSGVRALTIIYAMDCYRVRTATAWLPPNVESSEPMRPPTVSELNLRPSDTNPLTAPAPSSSSFSRRTWVWIGVSALVAGVIYVAQKEFSGDKSSQRNPEPVHSEGF